MTKEEKNDRENNVLDLADDVKELLKAFNSGNSTEFNKRLNYIKTTAECIKFVEEN